MKKIIFGFFLVMSSIAFSQEIYQVIAQEGLTIRTAPNGKRVGKIPYGYPVKILEKGEAFSIKDSGKAKSGNWVKIDISSSKLILDEGVNEAVLQNDLYTFSGYLITQQNFINQFETEIATHPAFNEFYLATAYKCFAIKGDFFGDGVVDYLYRMIDKKGYTRLYIVNNLKKGSQIYGLGGEKDPFKIKNYDFGTLMMIPKGTSLYSNYKDGIKRNLNGVSKNEIVTLEYDAIYVHQENAKEGGYIYRKDGKWNWLNQK
ncbi:SH3 domain-containing protein [Empedobacter stercoris]|uniref:SH3 domain-containing protein n=1 Tax=Empedobacter stercoris TaxID=1628248 RepID=UPI0021AE4B26|nr:SH3 domain-containing protein [Empedobacter stercoris]UWX66374.1 SH3 domain-containing protein [Empedobacter stercoris]